MASDPKSVALGFNECINRRDIDGLAALMCKDAKVAQWRVHPDTPSIREHLAIG